MSISSLNLQGISGYDFSSIIETMVSNYSIPLTKMQEQKSALETKKNAWRDINTRISALENTLSKLGQASTWTGTSATSSNTQILTAASKPGTVKGSYNIKVKQIALAQTVTSNTLAVESASSAAVNSAGTFRVTVGEKTTDITVSAGASLQDIAGTINNARAGVNASVVKVDGGYRLAVISTETGTAKAASFAEVQGNVLHSLGVLSEEDGGTILNISQNAQDAKLVVNGISEITSSSNTVSSVVTGLTLTLNESAPDTTVVVRVGANYEAAQSAVQSFIDQYNSVMTFIQEKMKYDKDTGTKGDLFGDAVLQGIQSRLRSMVSGNMDNPVGEYRVLSEVGIMTSADDYGKSAALQFDTAAFSKAMNDDPDSVAALFGAAINGVTLVRESSESQSAQGLANKMREYLHPLVMYDGTFDQTDEIYQNQLDDISDRILAFNDKIKKYQESLKLKFAALESQLTALDSQRSWLDAQINSLTASKDS